MKIFILASALLALALSSSAQAQNTDALAGLNCSSSRGDSVSELKAVFAHCTVPGFGRDLTFMVITAPTADGEITIGVVDSTQSKAIDIIWIGYPTGKNIVITTRAGLDLLNYGQVIYRQSPLDTKKYTVGFTQPGFAVTTPDMESLLSDAQQLYSIMRQELPLSSEQPALIRLISFPFPQQSEKIALTKGAPSGSAFLLARVFFICATLTSGPKRSKLAD